jgi:putative ABC transport system permease protein
MSGSVSPLGLATAVLLVAVAAGVSRWKGLRLERAIAWSAVRATAQLLAVGGVLVLLVSDRTPLWWSWVWVAVMIAYAGVVARRRAPEVPRIGRLTLAAFLAAGLVSLGVLFGLGVLPAQGRTVVPLAGMMIGNAMTATVLVARRIVDELRDKREEVEARLALGLPASAASAPAVRTALAAALTPQIESTKATGLVFLPGAMTGLILAGVSPLQAVQLQAVVMFLVLGSVAVTTSVLAIGVAHQLFTPDHRLRPIPEP